MLLSQARFEHAMILDSDNQLVPSGVATLYASARQTGAVLAYGNILKVDPSGSVMGVISNERVTANLLERELDRCHGPGPNGPPSGTGRV